MPTSKLAYLLLTAVAAMAQVSPELTRRVQGQTITSESLPAAILKFNDAFKYAGGIRFDLYGVAAAEQHFFVDADAGKNVKRIFWLQFEQYHPNNTNTYNYQLPRTVDIGPLNFFYDTRAYPDFRNITPRPNSDVAAMRSFFEKAGYKFPQAVLYARMIHLPGTDRRSELMIIYAETTPADQLPAGMKNGTPIDDKPEWAQALIQAVKQNLKIEPR